jgi:type II secretory ATPase GspE/PulE/Tfp pilus assembly ATPase PilB-like protein
MAQRLLRRLDDSSKQAYTPSEGEWQRINEVLATLPASIPKPNLEGLQLYKPGKSATNPFGYEGQVVAREQFTMSDDLRHLLENPKAQVSAQTIEAAASKSGMLTMVQDGMLKVLAGQTTLQELFRVVG